MGGEGWGAYKLAFASLKAAEMKGVKSCDSESEGWHTRKSMNSQLETLPCGCVFWVGSEFQEKSCSVLHNMVSVRLLRQLHGYKAALEFIANTVHGGQTLSHHFQTAAWRALHDTPVSSQREGETQ